MGTSITPRNNYKVLIPPTLDEISVEYEFIIDRTYTIMCDPLTDYEKITFELYNKGSDTWQIFKLSGVNVELSSNYEILSISNIGGICKFTKPISTNPISLTIIRR